MWFDHRSRFLDRENFATICKFGEKLFGTIRRERRRRKKRLVNGCIVAIRRTQTVVSWLTLPISSINANRSFARRQRRGKKTFTFRGNNKSRDNNYLLISRFKFSHIPFTRKSMSQDSKLVWNAGVLGKRRIYEMQNRLVEASRCRGR